MSPKSALSAAQLEMIESVFTNASLYEAAELLPTPDPTLGGRPRTYPLYYVLGFGCLADIYHSARSAASQLGGPLVYDWIRELTSRMVDDPSLLLPEKPPDRTWYIKNRNRAVEYMDALCDYLTTDGLRTARDIDLLDPNGPGTLTHPVRSRAITADGKVIAPLYKNMARGDTRTDKVVDPVTGEIIEVDVPVRNFDPDQKVHVTGDKRQVVGNKFWHAEVRGDRYKEQVFLAVAHVPGAKGEKNSEMDIAMPIVTDITQCSPGTLIAVMDGAVHGVNRSQYTRETGCLLVSPPTAEAVDPKTGDRTEKEAYLRTVTFECDDGTHEDVDIHHIGGWLARAVITDDGDTQLERLRRVENRSHPNKDGTFRNYVYYEVPDPRGGGSPMKIRERTWNNEEDARKNFNRAELIHQIPAGDPDYVSCYPWRSDSESINRQIDDSLPLRRARSLGAKRQLFDLWCHAFVVNSVTKHRYRRPAALPEQLTQAA